MESLGPGDGGWAGEGGGSVQVQTVLPHQEPPAGDRVPGGGEGQEQLRLVSSLQAPHLLHSLRQQRLPGGGPGPGGGSAGDVGVGDMDSGSKFIDLILALSQINEGVKPDYWLLFSSFQLNIKSHEM